MSSEYTIHINGDTVKGEVVEFSNFATAKITVGKSVVSLYAWTGEKAELATVLRELAESLAPDRCHRPFHPCPDCVEIGRQEGYEAERRPVGA